ncbi:YcaO-like family protein [Acidithiobacillus ferrooxidans]|uniref:YcaO-like family protein n=1 Tax=Acidithiobacillus ferrooxidans TaxID=920 RepID=UPI00214790AA|nr:YcaO-like family protein [Acidithiobacillus ferrooxidans]MCR1343953.1 YcaO-like family protein [Acidithiobacillus ferrooxidans]
MIFINKPQIYGIFSEATISRKPLWYSDMSFVSIQVNPAIRLTNQKKALKDNAYNNESSNLFVHGALENGIVGVGNDFNLDTAYQKAYSEAVERMSSFLMLEKDIVTEIPHKLEDNGIYYKIPHSNIDKNLMISFTNVIPLARSKKESPVLYPATHVYMGVSNQTCCHESLSTGKAAHVSQDKALVSGALELVERDSFVLFWLSRSGFTEIDHVRYFTNKSISKIFAETSRADISIRLYDITTDLLVPSILCYINQSAFPYNLISTASGLTYEDAIEHCLSEIMLGLISYTLVTESVIHDQLLSSIESTSDDVSLFPNGGPIRFHSDWYACDPGKSEAFDFLNTNRDKHLAPYRGTEFTGLRDLVTHLQKKGINMYYKNIDASHLSCGGRFVVSVVSPDLVPLYNSERGSSSFQVGSLRSSLPRIR